MRRGARTSVEVFGAGSPRSLLVYPWYWRLGSGEVFNLKARKGRLLGPLETGLGDLSNGARVGVVFPGSRGAARAVVKGGGVAGGLGCSARLASEGLRMGSERRTSRRGGLHEGRRGRGRSCEWVSRNEPACRAVQQGTLCVWKISSRFRHQQDPNRQVRLLGAGLPVLPPIKSARNSESVVRDLISRSGL